MIRGSMIVTGITTRGGVELRMLCMVRIGIRQPIIILQGVMDMDIPTIRRRLLAAEGHSAQHEAERDVTVGQQ